MPWSNQGGGKKGGGNGLEHVRMLAVQDFANVALLVR